MQIGRTQLIARKKIHPTQHALFRMHLLDDPVQVFALGFVTGVHLTLRRRAPGSNRSSSLPYILLRHRLVSAAAVVSRQLHESLTDMPERDRPRLPKKVYKKELSRLHIELRKMQRWIVDRGLRLVVIFEGRDAAGKGGAIKRITSPLNPRYCRVVALDKPTEREQTQWYFQRYVSHLPAAGEMVLFDRSWYNRAGVERVMGFCTDEEYHDFLHACPLFERLLVQDGIILVKYWFSVSAEEQARRFQARIDSPTKRWKLSAIDLEARSRWDAYSQAKDQMFAYTDVKHAPWHVVKSDEKRRARLNCIHHLLQQVDYEELPVHIPELPPKQSDTGYERPPQDRQRFVPDITDDLT